MRDPFRKTGGSETICLHGGAGTSRIAGLEKLVDSFGVYG
jgi:hypothetical protein